MVTAELGRRDRKRLATHSSLRVAALRLAAERGLHHVTVEDIAEAADVSVRTFFNHFPSKEDAVVGLDPERVVELRQALAARPAEETPLAALRAVLGELALTTVERSDEWPLRMEVVQASPDLLPRMMASFAAYERALVEVIACRTGTDPDRDLYPALTTAIAMGAFRAVLAAWRSSPRSRPLSEILDSAFTQVAAGLPAPAPAKELAQRRRGSGRPGASRRNRSSQPTRSATPKPETA
ncbi:MAG: TetR/AcrR family transcriptional regulator [Candidatus Dormibacteria bacterium]